MVCSLFEVGKKKKENLDSLVWATCLGYKPQSLSGGNNVKE
jgi:hypothetical protein